MEKTKKLNHVLPRLLTLLAFTGGFLAAKLGDPQWKQAWIEYWTAKTELQVITPPRITTDPNEMHVFRPFQGTVQIAEDIADSESIEYRRKTSYSITHLDGRSRKDIAEHRRLEVAQYAELGIFHEGYDPLAPPHDQIFGQIDSGHEWALHASYPISNPYFLSVLHYPHLVLNINALCPGAELSYTAAIAREMHRGVAAECWHREWYEYSYPSGLSVPEGLGVVGVETVNAQDAGFYYVFLDQERSQNIVKSSDPQNITNDVIRPFFLFHNSGNGINSLSPFDARFLVKLKERGAPTHFYFKFWRGKPASSRAPPDLVYEIIVEESGAQ